MWASDIVKKIYGYKPTNGMKSTPFKCYEVSIRPMGSIFNNIDSTQYICPDMHKSWFKL